MNFKNVYLAGKIEGISWDVVSGWRSKAARMLDDACIDCYNPCVHVPLQVRSDIITLEGVEDAGGMAGDEIFTQDVFHLNECNIFLVNLDNPGTGTLIELGMASVLGLTIVGFGASDDMQEYPFIYNLCRCIFDDLGEALDFIINL